MNAPEHSRALTPDDRLRAGVSRWLQAFQAGLAASDAASLQRLLKPDAHWRDMVALSGRVLTLSGGARIARALVERGAAAGIGEIAIDPLYTPPARVRRAGVDAIEAFFQFETARSRVKGIVRLDPATDVSDPPAQAFTLFTALEDFKGHEEAVDRRRPKGEVYSRDFSGPNWLDRRVADAAYTDRDPAVLVIGGGQAGLSIGARLRQLGVDTLVIDRQARIGDNWRHRYHALTLHNQVQANHLPYLSFPPNFPTYLPKDKVAQWFESYVDAMEINYWTGTEFVSGRYDEGESRWTVELRRDSVSRTMRPRHLVMATGASGLPIRPNVPGLADFSGPVIHASEYRSPRAWTGRHVTVLGTGTSGHDIAQDLVSNGASVTMIQRSPTLVVGVEPAAQLPYTLYNEGRSLDECDLIAASIPLEWLKATHRMLTTQSREIDRELLEGLRRAGFKTEDHDELGWQFMYLTRGGGYYFNVGCSNLIIEGKVPVRQYDDVERVVSQGLRMRSGEVLATDLIVLATGYRGQEAMVAQLLGDEVARRVGRVWGFDPDTQELNSMFTRTGQPGLWFHAGSFAQCRIYSKYLAQQILAAERGLA